MWQKRCHSEEIIAKVREAGLDQGKTERGTAVPSASIARPNGERPRHAAVGSAD
jgi:hypothetical protein